MRKTRLIPALILAAATALAGCQGGTSAILALGANAPLPDDVVRIMKAKGMTKSSPIMMRIFKEEGVLEVWKQTNTGRFDLVKSYEICKFSGELGPKFKEGDRQAPEGFYLVNRHLLNPNSDYHLSFNLGFPNAFDRAHGRTGTHLMVHGDCSSAGCYAMTDEQIAEIYAFARDALNGGQQEAFQVQAFPFRMTAENMARHRGAPHFEYWTMLKEGYDHFELTRKPPKIDVCDKRYVFNHVPYDVNARFNPAAQCPAMSMPDTLASAYQSHLRQETLAFEKALARFGGTSTSLSLVPPPISMAPAPAVLPEAAPVEPAGVAPATVPAPQDGSPATVPAPAAVIATASAGGIVRTEVPTAPVSGAQAPLPADPAATAAPVVMPLPAPRPAF